MKIYVQFSLLIIFEGKEFAAFPFPDSQVRPKRLVVASRSSPTERCVKPPKSNTQYLDCVDSLWKSQIYSFYFRYLDIFTFFYGLLSLVMRTFLFSPCRGKEETAQSSLMVTELGKFWQTFTSLFHFRFSFFLNGSFSRFFRDWKFQNRTWNQGLVRSENFTSESGSFNAD